MIEMQVWRIRVGVLHGVENHQGANVGRSKRWDDLYNHLSYS